MRATLQGGGTAMMDADARGNREEVATQQGWIRGWQSDQRDPCVHVHTFKTQHVNQQTSAYPITEKLSPCVLKRYPLKSS